MLVGGCGCWGRSWVEGVDDGLAFTAVAHNWASDTVRLTRGGSCGQLWVLSGFWTFCSSAPLSSSSSSSSPPGSLPFVGGSGTS